MDLPMCSAKRYTAPSRGPVAETVKGFPQSDGGEPQPLAPSANVQYVGWKRRQGIDRDDGDQGRRRRNAGHVPHAARAFRLGMHCTSTFETRDTILREIHQIGSRTAPEKWTW